MLYSGTWPRIGSKACTTKVKAKGSSEGSAELLSETRTLVVSLELTLTSICIFMFNMQSLLTGFNGTLMVFFFPVLKSAKGGCHKFCTALSRDVTYEELKKLLNSKKIILIDVRGEQEILEHGKIPGSVNIPLPEVDEALQMDPEDFKKKYKEAKPFKSDRVVFSCLAGTRSKKALGTAMSLGFSSAQHYPGGWKEWNEYECSERKQEK